LEINESRRVHRRRFKAVFRQANVVCGSFGLFGLTWSPSTGPQTGGDVKYWHCGSPETAMSHIAIEEALDGKTERELYRK